MRSKQKVIIITRGQRADSGVFKIDRQLPNRYVEAIGPFVFLDHVLPIVFRKNYLFKRPAGTGPHPHRGIATLTYVLHGQAEHYDSKGNHAKINSGGVQWMKAGNGIVHDESLTADPNSEQPLIHSFQFWVNLPAKNKAEEPEYLCLQDVEIPRQELDNDGGWLKVIAGAYKNLQSQIPFYTKQFVYHLHLEGNKCFSLETVEQMDYAAFLPLQETVINNRDYYSGELLVFKKDTREIEIKNVLTVPIDLILFGGEPYTEQIVADGPFVMNTQHEISLAYNDYYNGKYGEIKYD